MRFLLPQGIGDSVWALHKIQSVAKELGDSRMEVYLNCSEAGSLVQARALDFVKRFSFVDEANMLQISIHPYEWVDSLGRYNYIPSGPTNLFGKEFYVLMPNGHLERGQRLETWLPEFQINWNLMNHFRILEEEKEIRKSLKELGDYVVFYLGPLSGNLFCGHNREALWKPIDWIHLGARLHEKYGVRIVAVGAPYDDTYFGSLIEPLLFENKIDYWTDLIGATNVGELYSVTTGSRFMISYQSGVGIVSNYLGVPTGIFWRPKGDSINPDVYISFEEEMASAWANPEMVKSGKHMPLIYGRHGVDYIMEEVKRRNW